MTYKQIKQKYGQDIIDVATRVQLKMSDLGCAGQWSNEFIREMCELIQEGVGRCGDYNKTEAYIIKVVERKFA